VEAAVPADVVVWDGPAPSGDTRDAIHIGYDADPEGSAEAIFSERAANAFGPAQRGETVTVTCAAYALRGDGDTAAARTRIYALLDVLINAVETNPTLSIGASVTASVPSFRVLYVPSEQAGLEVVGTCTVEARCLPA
jgi:hypothetical protein